MSTAELRSAAQKFLNKDGTKFSWFKVLVALKQFLEIILEIMKREEFQSTSIFCDTKDSHFLG